MKTRLGIISVLGLVPLVILNGAECVLIMALGAFCHEAAHLCAIKYGGGTVKRIDIDFLAAEIVYSSEKMTFRSEMLNSLAGIAVNAALAAFSYLLYLRCPDIRLAFFSLCNAALASVNLLPVRGLDGYNALYYVLQMKYDANKAYEVCRMISSASAVLLVFAIFLIIIKTGMNTSVIMLFMLAAALKK